MTIDVLREQLLDLAAFPEHVHPGIALCELSAPLPERVSGVLALVNDHEAALLLQEQKLNLVKPAHRGAQQGSGTREGTAHAIIIALTLHPVHTG